MDVICAALACDTCASPSSASPDVMTPRQPNSQLDALLFRLCSQLSTSVALHRRTTAVVEKDDDTRSRLHDGARLYGELIFQLLRHGAGEKPLTRYVVWAEMAALPLEMLYEPVPSAEDNLCAPARRTVIRWALSSLWAAQLTASSTHFTARDTTRVVTCYARCCALMLLEEAPAQPLNKREQDATAATAAAAAGGVRSGTAQTAASTCWDLRRARSLPPLLWMTCLLAQGDARHDILHSLLFHGWNAAQDDDDAYMAWGEDCEAVGLRSCLHPVPWPCLAWLASGLPNGFEARLHAHMSFVLAALYAGDVDDGAWCMCLQTQTEEAPREPMSFSRFVSLMRALVSPHAPHAPLSTLHSLEEVAAAMAPHSISWAPPRERCGHTTSPPPALLDTRDDQESHSESSQVAENMWSGYETLATTAAACFVSHALESVGSMPSSTSPPPPPLSDSLPVLSSSSRGEQLLWCLERHAVCYGLSCTEEEEDHALKTLPSSVEEAHKAVSAALVLLATAGESPVALYLRHLFNFEAQVTSMTTTTTVVVASAHTEQATHVLRHSSPAETAQHVIQSSCAAVPWGVRPSSTTSAPDNDVFAFLSYDPAPFLVPSSLEEARDADDAAHTALLFTLARADKTATAFSPTPQDAVSPHGALRSPLRSTVAMTAVLLRHPWVQLSLLERVWRLCTAITASATTATTTSTTPHDDASAAATNRARREALQHTLHALHDIYAHSIVEAGVRPPGAAAHAGSASSCASPPSPQQHDDNDDDAAVVRPKDEIKAEDDELPRALATTTPMNPHGALKSAESSAPPQDVIQPVPVSDLPPPLPAELSTRAAPRRRLKLFSAAPGSDAVATADDGATAAQGKATAPRLRRALVLRKRPRDEASNEEEKVIKVEDVRHTEEEGLHVTDAPPRGYPQALAGEAVLPFREAVLHWCTPAAATELPSSAYSSSSSPPLPSFSLCSVVVEALLSMTRIVQDPLFDVLHHAALRAAAAAEPSSTTPSPPALPRLGLSLAVPACAALLQKLLSASFSRHTASTSGSLSFENAATSEIGADSKMAIMAMMGTIVSYFLYRWSSLLCSGVPAHETDVRAEGFRRLQRLAQPLLHAWPEPARAYLCYTPIHTQLLPRLWLAAASPASTTTVPCAQEREECSGHGAPPWAAWCRLLVQYNVMTA